MTTSPTITTAFNNWISMFVNYWGMATDYLNSIQKRPIAK